MLRRMGQNRWTDGKENRTQKEKYTFLYNTQRLKLLVLVIVNFVVFSCCFIFFVDGWRSQLFFAFALLLGGTPGWGDWSARVEASIWELFLIGGL